MDEQHPQSLPEESPHRRCYDALIALFFVGLVLFHPLVIGIFDKNMGSSVVGVPLLFFYIFAGWGLLISLLAIVVEYSRRHHAQTGEDSPRSEAS